ncbi:hypothetical protein DCS_00184 [Drechmeria coniospora]|uniref:Uncharacterized protein n=1 Tax=Drechmeria coniospora TaxID=98403 RepID=A0A151GPM5_DRECN|nr:hypothetical protein DCS_00184 [Drechmeria coniospora]KYK59057.1 hypothetical protein DCS_00184 [Drechmeria coniospora]
MSTSSGRDTAAGCASLDHAAVASKLVTGLRLQAGSSLINVLWWSLDDSHPPSRIRPRSSAVVPL